MNANILKKIGLIVIVGMGFLTNLYASSLEGYWKGVDDRTGDVLAIVEIKKLEDGTYVGSIFQRFYAPDAYCTRCPEPYKNKAIVGMQILSGFKEDPNKPNHFIHGKVLEPRTGKIYEGKGQLVSGGRRFRLRGYIGVSLLGRTQVWVKVTNPAIELHKP